MLTFAQPRYIVQPRCKANGCDRSAQPGNICCGSNSCGRIITMRNTNTKTNTLAGLCWSCKKPLNGYSQCANLHHTVPFLANKDIINVIYPHTATRHVVQGPTPNSVITHHVVPHTARVIHQAVPHTARVIHQAAPQVHVNRQAGPVVHVVRGSPMYCPDPAYPGMQMTRIPLAAMFQ